MIFGLNLPNYSSLRHRDAVIATGNRAEQLGQTASWPPTDGASRGPVRSYAALMPGRGSGEPDTDTADKYSNLTA